MEIRVYEDIEEFYALAFPFLITREAENNFSGWYKKRGKGFFCKGDKEEGAFEE